MRLTNTILVAFTLILACSKKEKIEAPEHSFEGMILRTTLVGGESVENRLVAFCTDPMDDGFRAEIGVYRLGGNDGGLADILIRETKLESNKDGYSFSAIKEIGSLKSLKISTEHSVMLVSTAANSTTSSSQLDTKPDGTLILAIPLENSKDLPMEVKVTIKGYLEKTISCKSI